MKSYDMLKNHLSLSRDYAFFAITFTVKNVSATAIRQAEITFDGEIKETNASGITIFYRRAGSNYYYEITADGYISDNDDNNLVDVAADVAVNAYEELNA